MFLGEKRENYEIFEIFVYRKDTEMELINNENK